MKKTLITTYIIGIHAFLLYYVLFQNDSISQAPCTPGMNLVPHNEAFMHYQHMIGTHARMDANVPKGAVVFIGDSITQGLCLSAIVPTSVNYGIGGDTTVGVLQRLQIYGSLQKAGAVVVAIGVNDLKYNSTNEEILRNYANIIEQMPEDIPIILSAIFPIDEEIRTLWPGWNQRILALNTDLKALALKSKNHFFTDTGRLLVDTKGNLADTYHDGDGIHLNAKGNAVWIIELQKTLKNAQQGIVSQ
jgi:lysophospholipase L1-like esterase